jgi:hypothetical protein
MSRKIHRVPFQLDPKDVKELPLEEIKVILRGADDLIMEGGRTVLSKVLKGSRQKRLLELGLDQNPAYGYYKDLTLGEIMARIDWVILNGYLDIEYDYRLPLLVFTNKGWEIERETYANELLEGFNELLLRESSDYNMEYLKDRNRGMIMMLLDKVEDTEDERYIPILEAWHEIDYKKVKRRIESVIDSLRSP